MQRGISMVTSGAYNFWRARRDLERLAYDYNSQGLAHPHELRRITDFLDELERELGPFRKG